MGEVFCCCYIELTRFVVLFFLLPLNSPPLRRATHGFFARYMRHVHATFSTKTRIYVLAHSNAHLIDALILNPTPSSTAHWPIKSNRRRRRNRTTQSCLNCHTSKRKVRLGSATRDSPIYIVSVSAIASAHVPDVFNLVW